MEVCREREVSRMLQKLSGLVGEESAGVRPHHLVKVLEGLKPWQLCLPDLCVVIEVWLLVPMETYTHAHIYHERVFVFHETNPLALIGVLLATSIAVLILECFYCIYH